MKKRIQQFISISALLFVLPFIFSKILPFEDVNNKYVIRGEYNKDFLTLNTLEKIESRLNNMSTTETKTWVDSLDSLLRYRFYHGTCRYNFNENWLAFSLGIFFWDDFRMIVKPEHILQKKVAVCNQVNIVFQTLLKRNNIRYRSVGLNHHLVTEVFYNNSWNYYDADYEPKFDKRPSAEELISDTVLFREIYSNTNGAFFNPHFENILNTTDLTYNKENTSLAVKLSLFQSLCFYISEYAWILLLLLTVLTKYI